MSNLHFLSPPITPLKRLHVYDSLMMNAQRWLLAHEYHRRRQNVHYQSINQPGIVCGLGVNLTKFPESTGSRFRDQRWIEIQPGIAIDVEGNVIVVDQTIDRKYRIAAKPPATGSITIYVVVSYVEPELPDYQQPEILQEQFRFDQKTCPPVDHEIELCRIQLGSDFVHLETPGDVLFPQQNQLDLSHRISAQAKPIATVSVAQLKPNSAGSEEFSAESLASLTRSTPALYPTLQGNVAIDILPIAAATIEQHDLLYLAASHLSDLTTTEQDLLNSYLTTGGVLLIELPFYNELVDHFKDWITQVFYTTLTPWQNLPTEHPLRSHPFLFAALPTVDQAAIQLWSGDGIVLVVGTLSAAWAPDRQLERSRNEIRTAQEFGINLLHFAWRRRHLTRLLQVDAD